MNDLRKDIATAINRHSAENGSDTPDFILAKYLTDCLHAFDRAVVFRENWYNWRSKCNHPTETTKEGGGGPKLTGNIPTTKDIDGI